MDSPIIISSEQKAYERLMLIKQEKQKLAEQEQKNREKSPARPLTKIEKLQRANDDLRAEIKDLDEQYEQFMAQPIVVEVDPITIPSKDYTEKYNKILAAVGRSKQPEPEPVVEESRDTRKGDTNKVSETHRKTSLILGPMSAEVAKILKDAEPKKKKKLINYAEKRKNRFLPKKPSNTKMDNNDEKQTATKKSSVVSTTAKSQSGKASATTSRSSLAKNAKSSTTQINEPEGTQSMSAEVANIVKDAEPKKKKPLIDFAEKRKKMALAKAGSTSSLSKPSSSGAITKQADLKKGKAQPQLTKASQRGSGLIVPTKSATSIFFFVCVYIKD